MKNNNKGYTLVELLVSLAIFSIIIVGIILFMRNASVAYKNENIEVNVQKEAQIFLSQVEDLVIDSTASISTTTDGAGNPKYVITNPDGVSSITFIPGADGLGKVYYNDSYLMAEKVENFVIDKTTANDNSCTIKAVLAYNDASSNKRSYSANKEVYFRNTAIENNADHVLDLSVSATGTGPVTTANSRVIDRFEIVNVKDEFGIVTVTGIDNNYYKCLKTDSPTYYNATTDAVVKPDYASGNTFLVTTSTGVNDNPATNVASSTLTGVDASGSTVTVTLSTPAVSMSHGTGVIEYPIGSVNTSSGSGYFVSYIPLAGFDVNDYNKYWKSSSSSYSAIKYDLQILNNGSNVKSVTGKTVTQYLDATYSDTPFNNNKVRWDNLSNNGYSTNQGDAMILCADDYNNDDLVVVYNNEGTALHNPDWTAGDCYQIFDNGKIKVKIKIYLVKSNGTTTYSKEDTYTMVTSGTPLSGVN
jgi:prepilin-type N-terminal cleavage/methylation domain-containing protein